jgi:hypothetical protein
VGSYTTTRPITKPVAGSLTLYLNGVATATGWTLDTTTGVLTTTLTGAIAVDFEFDVPVRFAEDQIKFTFNAADPFDATRRIFTLDALTCTEIRIEPTIYPAIEPLPLSMPLFDLGYDYGTNGGPQFDTGIASTASEFESRIPYLDSPKGSWNIGDRTLDRAQVDYFLAFYRLCRGMAVPFSFKDWQDETVKSTRFAEDRISLQFNAYRPHDQQVIFYLGGLAIAELPPPSKIDAETYVIPIIDMTSLTAPEISNIQSAITQLRNLLASSVYGGMPNANKYVKAPVEKNDERYVLWGSEDYRDSGTEPKKFLFLMFVDESNQCIGSPESPSNSYHYIPRNMSVEPTDLWLDDFNTFIDVYPILDKFYSLVFSPTGSPPTSSENAFNPHLIDAMAGNNGYPALSQYGWTGKPYWDEDATGQDIYNAIIEFIS